MVVAVHFDSYVDGLEQAVFVDAGEDEVAFVESLGTLGGGADADGGDRFADREEETRLFGQCARVADYSE